MYSKRTNRILKTHLAKSGYSLLATRVLGKAITFRVHVLVAEAFLPEPSQDLKTWAEDTKYGKVLVNHIDSNKSNNTVENLEWSNSSLNMKHYSKTERGVEHHNYMNRPRAKLTDAQVKYIRDDTSIGVSQRKLATELGISRSLVQAALSGYKWVT